MRGEEHFHRCEHPAGSGELEHSRGLGWRSFFLSAYFLRSSLSPSSTVAYSGQWMVGQRRSLTNLQPTCQKYLFAPQFRCQRANEFASLCFSGVHSLLVLAPVKLLTSQISQQIHFPSIDASLKSEVKYVTHSSTYFPTPSMVAHVSFAGHLNNCIHSKVPCFVH